MLRVDPANHVLGLRLNVWTSLLLCCAAIAFLILRRLRTRPTQHTIPAEAVPAGAATADQSPAAAEPGQATVGIGRPTPSGSDSSSE